MTKLTFEQYCNEPAFPSISAGVSRKYIVKEDPFEYETYIDYGRPGITRLEYFTAKMMQVIGLNSAYVHEKRKEQMAQICFMAEDVLRTMYEIRYGAIDQ